MMNKAPSRVTADILELADDMLRIGVMDEETHQQITVRHLGREPLASPKRGKDIDRSVKVNDRPIDRLRGLA